MAAAKKQKTLRIELARGLAGKDREHRHVARSIGLRRPGQIVEKPDTPSIRGQIARIHYLVRVEEV